MPENEQENPITEHSRLERADRDATFFLYQKTQNRIFDIMMPALSLVATRGFLFILVGSLMWMFGDAKVKSSSICMAASALGSVLLVEHFLKKIWNRKRPFMVDPRILPRVRTKRLARRASFPSGHAAGYFAAAVSLSMCFPLATAPLLAIAALGSFSRIYNGVHFVSDVLAGALVGAVAAAAITFYLSAPLAGVAW